MGTLVSRGAGNAYYINAQELIAVLLAIKTYSTGKEHLNILIQTENMTAKAYVNHMGGSHSPTLNSIAIEMWKWCLDTCQQNICQGWTTR